MLPLKRRVLWVLAELGGERHPSMAAARGHAYGAIDPLSASWVRARVRRAVAEVMLITSHAGDEAHVHRAAYLLIALGAAAALEPSLTDDRDEVRARFDELTTNHRRPLRWGLPLFAVGAVAGIATIAIAAWALWPKPYAELDIMDVPSSGAYRRGGRPDPGSAAMREVFANALPEVGIALDGVRLALESDSRGVDHARSRFRRARADLLAQSTAALGADTTSFVMAVIDQAMELVDGGDASGGSGGGGASSHVRSVDALNQALAERNLGFYVDVEVIGRRSTGRMQVFLSTFTVEHARIFQSGDQHVRALRLRRLDHLNFARAVLGFTREDIRDAVVLLDRTEEHLVNTVLPALANGASMAVGNANQGGTEPSATGTVGTGPGTIGSGGAEPGDSGSTAAPWVAELARQSGEQARKEVAGLFAATEGVDRDDARDLGDLFGRRRAYFRRLEALLARHGRRLVTPDGYRLDLESYASLEDLIPAEDWYELRDIDSQLAAARTVRSYRVVEDAVLRSVERHEAQHRLDYRAGRLDRLPNELEILVGPLGNVGGENSLAKGAVAELSAYVAELARADATPKITLMLFAQNVLDDRRWGSAECSAAIVTLEGLAAQLRIVGDGIVEDRLIRRWAAGALLLNLLTSDAGAIRAASRRLWEHLFEEELPPLDATG